MAHVRYFRDGYREATWTDVLSREWLTTAPEGRVGHGGPCGKQVVPDRREHATPSEVVGASNMFDKPCRMWAGISGTWSGVFQIGRACVVVGIAQSMLLLAGR
jgi:hypothetical protein